MRIPRHKMKILEILVVLTSVVHTIISASKRTTIDEEYTPIRLAGGSGPWQGRVEIAHNGMYGTMCKDSYFKEEEAKVLCRMLGYPTTSVTFAVSGTPGHGPIWLDRLECTGKESDIGECYSHGWDNAVCSHTDDVWLNCPTTQIRLTNGTSKAEGRLEVYHQSSWGTACSIGWNHNSADVVCRMLGFNNSSALVYHNGYFGAGTGSIALHSITCTGYEADIGACNVTWQSPPNCSHDMDVGISCTAYRTRNPDYNPSLAGSEYGFGQLMLSKNGSQLNVCTNAVNATTAQTVCRLLGFETRNGEYSVITDDRFGPVSGSPVVSRISCQGDETLLEQCVIETSSSCSSGHTDALGLSCVQSHVRLVDGLGRWSGRLEVQLSGTYGTVCQEKFDYREATIVCNMLIKNSGVTLRGRDMGTIFPPGSGPVKLGYLTCSGHENDLAHCSASYSPHSQHFNDTCGHSEDVGVQCTADVPVRLVRGNYSGEGRVEMQLNGEWGSPCSISDDDARVICRKLGYWNSAPVVRGSGYFGFGLGPRLVDRLNCDGSEPDIGICQWDNSSNICRFYHDMGVSCNPSDLSSSNIRLFGDHRPWRGVVEIRPDTSWGTLYYPDSKNHTADPICRTLGFRWLGNTSCYPAHPAVRELHVLTSMTCNGTEKNIGHCMSTADTFQSRSGYSLNVDCIGSSPHVRLVNGSTPLEGRVEILYNGQWGTVCDSGWDSSDTTIVCRSLGFESTGNHHYSNAYFGQGTGKVHFTRMGCHGSEYHIAQCPSQNGSSCSHSDDIGVKCSDCVQTFSGETGSMTSSTSARDCFYVIKPGSGKYKLNVTSIEKKSWSSHSQSVQIRDGPVGEFLGEYSEPGTAIIAGREFWIHYKAQNPSFTSLELTWSPLKVEDVIAVDCTQERWNVSVNVTNLAVLYSPTFSSSSNIYLGDCHFPLRYIHGKIYMTPWLRDCNTQKKISGNIVSYENHLAYREESTLIWSGDRWNVRIQCKLSTESLTHIEVKPVDGALTGTAQTVTGSGHPETHIAMFTDPYYYRDPVTDGMSLQVGQTVYVKVTLSSSNPSDKMVVQDCYAKPTADAPQSRTYTLIDNGCVVDPHTHIDTTVDTETRFHFNMFAFTFDKPFVHVYCDTSYCDKADTSVVCQHGCRSAGNTGRRSVEGTSGRHTVKLPSVVVV